MKDRRINKFLIDGKVFNLQVKTSIAKISDF